MYAVANHLHNHLPFFSHRLGHFWPGYTVTMSSYSWTFRSKKKHMYVFITGILFFLHSVSVCVTLWGRVLAPRPSVPLVFSPGLTLRALVGHGGFALKRSGFIYSTNDTSFSNLRADKAKSNDIWYCTNLVVLFAVLVVFSSQH
jgi:hypothetical protein